MLSSFLKKKMTAAWLPNGIKLAWLLDPIEQKAWIYEPEKKVVEVPSFDQKISGGEVLPGFEIDLKAILEP